jgi:hypothetical protein
VLPHHFFKTGLWQFFFYSIATYNQKDAYSLKIAALARSKNIAEKNVFLLEKAMLESSSQSKAMKNQLLKTVKDLTLQISSQRESSQRALTVALENQSELHKKVEHLTAKLALRERREAEMRRFLENDLQKKLKFVEDRSRTMAESLARDLKVTRKVVDSLTRENKELISAIEQLEHEHRNVLDVLEFTEELTAAAEFETERSEKFALKHRNANLRALSAETLAEAMVMELAQKDNALLESLESNKVLKKLFEQSANDDAEPKKIRQKHIYRAKNTKQNMKVYENKPKAARDSTGSNSANGGPSLALVAAADAFRRSF